MPRRCSGKTADELPTCPYATWDWIERTFTTGRDGRTRPASALEDGHVERAEPFGVGAHVDGGDDAVGEGEREHHPRLPALRPDQVDDAVDQREPRRPGAAGER